MHISLVKTHLRLFNLSSKNDNIDGRIYNRLMAGHTDSQHETIIHFCVAGYKKHL